MKIYKYKIQEELMPALSSVKMPQGSKPLYAGLDEDNKICVWAEVIPPAVMTDHHFQTVSTGDSIPRHIKSLGMVKSGVVILHAYWVAS
jgi:hypothetical protein